MKTASHTQPQIEVSDSLRRADAISIQLHPREITALVRQALEADPKADPRKLIEFIGKQVQGQIAEMVKDCARGVFTHTPLGSGDIIRLPKPYLDLYWQQIIDQEEKIKARAVSTAIPDELRDIVPMIVPEPGFGMPGANLLERQVFSLLGIKDFQITRKDQNDKEQEFTIDGDLRDRKVLLVHGLHKPLNARLSELGWVLEALHRNSAGRVSLLVPYCGGARQDRTGNKRTHLSARKVLRDISNGGENYVVVMDAHNPTAFENSVSRRFYNLFSSSVFVPYLMNYVDQHYPGARIKIVAPDFGAAQRAEVYAKLLGLESGDDLAIIRKKRNGKHLVESMTLIGDVKDCVCIIPDDIFDTAGTAIQAAATLLDKKAKAKAVIGCATHPVLSKDAYWNLINSPFDAVVMGDTIPWPGPVMGKLHKVSVAPVLAKAALRLYGGENKGSLRELAKDVLSLEEVMEHSIGGIEIPKLIVPSKK